MEKSKIFDSRAKDVFKSLLVLGSKMMTMSMPSTFSDEEMLFVRSKFIEYVLSDSDDPVQFFDACQQALSTSNDKEIIRSLLAFFDNQSNRLSGNSQQSMATYIPDEGIRKILWEFKDVEEDTTEYDAHVLTLRFAIERYLCDALVS